ncbi:hypothetical protein [Mucilaginibacter sp. L3T2-6]|uniref:hypothetical protein n=1 Tax=Mucilaginibacter sp. L3T2-6 TaxID=3062491 RepID=UPI0026754CFC|nr:hypothetical protein [Mucilaginibacter sp. L3T2-6]MDO3645158.1 hypothetical protein [Mucilaginibacter sp. L3T2-6]MDV6217642.1 hypothetical protein [Mucilaginibacter sp. L3T2-6]
MKTVLQFFFASIVCLFAFIANVQGQAELQPWGNITGIRSHGQLFNFESSLRIVSTDRKHVTSTAKEKQQPHYRRVNDDEQEVTSWIDSLYFKENVREDGSGKIKITVNITSHKDTTLQGIYFCVALPHEMLNAGLRYKDGDKSEFENFTKAAGPEFDDNAKEIEFETSDRKLSVKPEEKSLIMVRTDSTGGGPRIMLFIPINLGGVKTGEMIEKSFAVKVSGDIDKSPANITLNTNTRGRAFEGLGGNFRLQNPTADPQVIDYSLKNLRLAWGRVEMPWRFWQPGINIDPTAVADSGKAHPAVLKAMEMAHRLDSLGIPVILSAWFPPQWAAEGTLNMRPVNGIWGNKLNKDNMDAIYKSIADYIIYLKNKYGVQVKLFSFNESDLGINVRVTAEEHDEFIKGCGAYFAAHGLQTKMLLGDNSDANTYKFIYPALNDPDAKQYIGAISFHSWRGWDTETLKKWADAATKLNVPLLVGEGSIDAAAWGYPDIFQEQTYALEEINLYTRILAICQPASILQWQLTADYSPLIGGGIFGNDEPLHPGQRFYNLKQLSITPKGLYAMPVSCDKPDLSCAAMGDNGKNSYALHIVNNGGKRKVVLHGLPASVKRMDVYSTSKDAYMKQSEIKVNGGIAAFNLPETCYTTLISK